MVSDVPGISYFVAASYTEDKFGVVQKDLPDILSMMLDLQMVSLDQNPCFLVYIIYIYKNPN